MENSVILNDITKRYNDQLVLKNISYKFQNKLYVLSGINGSGKSTLVKIITNIVMPTKGVVITKGRVCYLPEKFELPRNMTTFNLIKMFSNKEKATNILSDWKIPNIRLNSLSKGNFQKVGILYMLMHDAEVYIFDEPTDSLDVDVVNTFKNAIKILQEKEKCIIIILHQLNIDELNPKKIFIKEGELCEE